MSMDIPSFQIYESEPEGGYPDFKDKARETDFNQPSSAIRSTIQSSPIPGEEQPPPHDHQSPVIESGVEGTLGSSLSRPRLTRSGRIAMKETERLYSSAAGRSTHKKASPASPDEDPSHSNEELLAPQPKRRKVSGAVPFTSIGPRIARTTSSTPTIKGNDPESAPTPDNDSTFAACDIPSATVILTTGMVPATVLGKAFFGAAQALKYRGPRNPISRHMKFPEEQALSDESVDEDRPENVKVKKGMKVMWTDGWWSELHEINGVKRKAGQKGNNLVKDRSWQLGGDKRG